MHGANLKLLADQFSLTEYAVVGKQTLNGIPCHTPISMCMILYYRRVLGFKFVDLCHNCYVLGKSGQIANLMFANVDPMPYYRIRACLCLQI